MGNFEKLREYGALGYKTDYREHVDKENDNTIRHAQFDLIQKQKQEIIEERKYREEMRKSATRSFRYTIIAIVIASLTLLATVITWFV